LNTQLKPHLALLATNFFFGINFSAVQHITKNLVGPFALNVIRVGVCTILFWALLALYPQKAGIQKKHIGRFILCAITGVVINQALFIKGLSLTLSIHASLLILVTPILITVAATFLAKEGLSTLKIAGLMAGIGGAAMLALHKESHGSGQNILLGDIFIIINSISYTFYFIMVKQLMAAYTPLHVIRWVFTLGLPFIVLIGYNEFIQIDWPAFVLTDWLALFLIVIGATFFAYLFNLYGISKLGASVTGAYIYTQPVFATIIAISFLNESLTIYKCMAATLIITGVILVSKKRTQ
jgi:drug/metabolite transporter (DMT)-like permease